MVFCEARPPLLRARSAWVESEVTNPSQTRAQTASTSVFAKASNPLATNPSWSAPISAARRDAAHRGSPAQGRCEGALVEVLRAPVDPR